MFYKEQKKAGINGIFRQSFSLLLENSLAFSPTRIWTGLLAGNKVASELFLKSFPCWLSSIPTLMQ